MPQCLSARCLSWDKLKGKIAGHSAGTLRLGVLAICEAQHRRFRDSVEPAGFHLQPSLGDIPPCVSRKRWADADFNADIVAAVVRREPSVDFQTADAADLGGLDDFQVLTLAAREGRILVTHDRRTMPIVGKLSTSLVLVDWGD
jgi:hypothetical protein